MWFRQYIISYRVIKVVVTGAAGQIAYSLIPMIANGSVFGEHKIHLAMVDLSSVPPPRKLVCDNCATELPPHQQPPKRSPPMSMVRHTDPATAPPNTV